MLHENLILSTDTGSEKFLETDNEYQTSKTLGKAYKYWMKLYK
jgi:hypothetical protein